MTDLLDRLRLAISLNVQIAYNDKIIDMGYVREEKKQFSVGCMRIQDNLCTGGYSDSIGYIKDRKGNIYKVERGSKLAKKIEKEEEEEKNEQEN